MFSADTIRKPNVVSSSAALETMDADSDKGRQALHRLDYETWLPFASKLYKVSPRIDDYIIVCVPICPSDIPNRNGIGFPLAELTKFQAPPVSRMAYKAWAGCPLHYNHKNEIHEDAYGVILDASLHKISGYANGKLWKVMGLAAVEKYKYPEMARRVKEGDINTYSMGALVDSFTCSYCDAEVTKRSHCSHVNLDRDINWQTVRDYEGNNHVAFLNAHGINPIEVSLVEEPAWTTALSDTILTHS